MQFIPGYSPAPQRLLARFLPPQAEGVAAHYIEQHSKPGDLILDPFGQSPQPALEALHLGRRIIIASFNPVSRLALSLALRPPTEAELRLALTRLGDQPKDNDRLENYLRRLYRTDCAQCGTEVYADTFEWEAGDPQPELIAKTYVCPHCGGAPQSALATAADRAHAKHFVPHALDYYLLLDRVAPRDDPDRAHAEEALAVYPPRALAAMAAVLVKLDAFHADREIRRHLYALLVAAFDAVCPLTQERPKILTPPTHRYMEINFWLALEKAVGLLAGVPAPDRSAPLADLLASGTPGVHAHPDSVRELAPHLPPGACALALSTLIRPNQAYWTLSAVWSAWLWGRESAAALRTVLHRRRYDWAWHAHALARSFAGLKPALAPEGKLIELMAEAEPGFTACTFTAAHDAGYALKGAALRADTAEAQFLWIKENYEAKIMQDEKETLNSSFIIRPCSQALRARGEPARWLTFHFNAWRALAENGRLPSTAADEALGAAQHQLEPVFRSPQNFQRLDADPDDDLATGLWYLPPALAADPASVPLSDHVETEVLRRLALGNTVDEMVIQRAVCAAFPGANTPDHSLVQACLSSYASEREKGWWQLRPEDETGARAEEVMSIQADLRALASRIGCEVTDTNPQAWREGGQTAYIFVVMASAIISPYLLGPLLPAQHRFLVLPGGRAGLAAFKIRRDPRLRAVMQSGQWRILKFRNVRRMVSDPQLTRATLELAFYADPLEEAKQLALIN